MATSGDGCISQEILGSSAEDHTDDLANIDGAGRDIHFEEQFHDVSRRVIEDCEE